MRARNQWRNTCEKFEEDRTKRNHELLDKTKVKNSALLEVELFSEFFRYWCGCAAPLQQSLGTDSLSSAVQVLQAMLPKFVDRVKDIVRAVMVKVDIL